MNSLKGDPLEVMFERTLGRILQNWTKRSSPSSDRRAALLKSAGDIQNKRVKGIQGLLYQRQVEANPHRELTMLFYAPQMSYMTALINF